MTTGDSLTRLIAGSDCEEVSGGRFRLDKDKDPMFVFSFFYSGAVRSSETSCMLIPVVPVTVVELELSLGVLLIDLSTR